MTNINLPLEQLVAFHEEPVTHETALKYQEEMKKAKTPFVTVEKNKNNKYNVIGGFKYIAGLRSLQNDSELYCTVVKPFQNERERKLAMLQCCLVYNEKIKYKELLVHDLTKEHKMYEWDISRELGQDADKIKKYMYSQVLPKTYHDDAVKENAKSLVQAIYLANNFTSLEKRVLTELCLYQSEDYRFKRKHMALYNRYRKKYSLFPNFDSAKKQVLQAIHVENAQEEHWKTIPHPNYYYETFIFNTYENTNQTQ